MKLYMIKHIPTGMFWKPSKYGSKANLSKRGKVYHSRPNYESYLKSYAHGYSYTMPKKNGYGWETVQIRTSLKDWELIEIEAGAK